MANTSGGVSRGKGEAQMVKEMLDYRRPNAPPPPDRWAVRSGRASLACLMPFFGLMGWIRLLHREVPPECFKYFFVCSLAGVFAGMICVDRANGRLWTGWLGLLLNAGVAGLFMLLAVFHG